MVKEILWFIAFVLAVIFGTFTGKLQSKMLKKICMSVVFLAVFITNLTLEDINIKYRIIDMYGVWGMSFFLSHTKWGKLRDWIFTLITRNKK